MKNSRLIKLLSTFKLNDCKSFNKFIYSPYFNQKKDLIKLYEFLEERLFYVKIIPTKEQVNQHLYPDKQFDAQRIRSIMNQLLSLLDQFLLFEELKLHPFELKLHAAKAYRKRNLDDFFIRTINVVNKKLEDQTERNSFYHYTKFQVEKEQYLFTSLGRRNHEQNLELISYHLDLAYFTMKLKEACMAVAHQAVYKTDYNLGFLNNLIQFLRESDYLTYPGVAAYYHCYFALTGPDEDLHFKKLKEYIFQFSNQFAEEELQDLFLLAINYCIRKLNETSDQVFAEEGLELYRGGLEKGLLYTNGYLTPYTYRNIIALGLLIKEYGWVEWFLHTYKDRLEKVHREHMFHFNLAKLEYQRQNYDKAILLLQQSSYNDLLLNLAAKTILLKIYYELDEYDLLNAQLESMKIFIRRKKIIGYHKKNYQQIIYYIGALMNLNFYDKAAKKGLVERIEQEPVLTEKSWLLSQLI